MLARDFASAVTFLTDVPLLLSSLIHEDRFVPENEADGELMDRLGTDQPYHQTGLLHRTRTFSAQVDAGGVSVLLERPAGVRLYAEAVKCTTDVAQFGALWRVLESAFERSDDALVQLLASYGPAQELKFDEAELKGLLILRGRAGHAQSKAGVQELITIERECGFRLERLKNLVERVIMTKESWGYPTTGVEELARLEAYIGPDGNPIFFQSKGGQG